MKKTLVYFITSLILLCSCFSSKSDTRKCKGFKYDYINDDTLRYQTDLKYYNYRGDTVIYSFESLVPDAAYECTNSPINHCECESTLKIEYVNRETGENLDYVFYCNDKKGLDGGSITFKGGRYFYDDNNDMTYDSLLTVNDEKQLLKKEIKTIYVGEGHMKGFVDKDNVSWFRIE